MSALAYLYVALGGALGSVGRAAISVGMTRLTGPAFPWGTILINVLGSFLISFFGTLTLSDARFPVAPDWRAFVMVGICGGFTTFSSFSLQTLDLARDGRPGQALGNIGLSVVLCLLSVAAGHYAAAHWNETAAAAESAAPPAAAAPILALLPSPDRGEAVLAAAGRLSKLTGNRAVDRFALRASPDPDFMPTEDVLTEESGATLSPADIQAHSIVVASSGGLPPALLASGRPLLLVPAGPAAPDFGRIVAIAWRDDPHCRAAIESATRILRQAAQVHLLTVGEPVPVPPALAAQGIAARQHALAEDGDTAGDTLLRAAASLGADLLVMGAYAHGPLREAVFGGVTQHVVQHATLPVLLRHQPDAVTAT